MREPHDESFEHEAWLGREAESRSGLDESIHDAPQIILGTRGGQRPQLCDRSIGQAEDRRGLWQDLHEERGARLGEEFIEERMEICAR